MSKDYLLSPCPFCGGKAHHSWPQGDGKVRCTQCPATIWYGPPKDIYTQAELNIQLWNNRKPSKETIGLDKLPEKIHGWRYLRQNHFSEFLPTEDMGNVPWSVYIKKEDK